MALRMQREVVVFPHPLSPTSDRVSPRLRKKVTSSTAFTWPTVFWRSPFRMGKYFLSPLTSRSADFSEPAVPFFIVVRCGSLVEKTAHLSSIPSRQKQRVLGVAAAGYGGNAAGMERATRRPVERVRNRPADGRELQPWHGVDAWNGLEQGLRIRVFRVVKDVVDLALLHHAAQ